MISVRKARAALAGRISRPGAHVHPYPVHLSAVLYPREWYMKEVVPAIQGVPNHWYDYYAGGGDGKPAAQG